MPLSPIVESIDTIPESLREFYRAGTEKEGLEGKFLLDVSPVSGWSLENVDGLKNALAATRAERDSFSKQVKGFGDITPETVGELKAKLKKLEESGNPDTAAIEAVKNQLTEKHMAEVQKYQQSLQSRDNEIEELLINSKAIQAITENKGNVKLLLPHIKNMTRVVRDENGSSVVVLQDDGKTPRLSKEQGNHGNMGVEELVKHLRDSDDFSMAFQGSDAAGSGKGKSSVPSNTNPLPSQGAANGSGTRPDFVKQFKAEREASSSR